MRGSRKLFGTSQEFGYKTIAGLALQWNWVPFDSKCLDDTSISY